MCWGTPMSSNALGWCGNVSWTWWVCFYLCVHVPVHVICDVPVILNNSTSPTRSPIPTWHAPQSRQIGHRRRNPRQPLDAAFWMLHQWAWLASVWPPLGEMLSPFSAVGKWRRHLPRCQVAPVVVQGNIVVGMGMRLYHECAQVSHTLLGAGLVGLGAEAPPVVCRKMVC